MSEGYELDKIPGTITISKNGISVENGDFISLGEPLTIIVTPNAGYSVEELTIGGNSFNNGAVVTLPSNIDDFENEWNIEDGYITLQVNFVQLVGYEFSSCRLMSTQNSNIAGGLNETDPYPFELYVYNGSTSLSDYQASEKLISTYKWDSTEGDYVINSDIETGTTLYAGVQYILFPRIYSGWSIDDGTIEFIYKKNDNPSYSIVKNHTHGQTFTLNEVEDTDYINVRIKYASTT